MNKNNSDESTDDIPLWINKNYIENFVKIYFKDDTIKIINFYPKWATKKGENYVSLMIRIIIEYQSYRLKYGIEKFIIKSSIDNQPIVNKIIKEYRAFEDEMLMYNEVFPKIQNLLNNIEIYKNNSIFPKPIYCDFQRNTIILEDLTPCGYKIADRIKGLNDKHLKLALKKLAIFHASSIVLNQMNPGYFMKFDYGLYNRHTNGIYNFYCKSMEKICDILATFDGEFINYSKKIRNLIPYWIEKELKCFDPKSNQLNVLAHGDFWTNNIMYKYDNNNDDDDDDMKQPIDAILIDFQFSVWSSPSIDLHYLFHTSMADLPNIDKMEELIKFYYFEFIENLKLFNCYDLKVPSLERFICEFWENGFHGVQACFLNKAVAFLEDNNAACPEALFCEGEKSEIFQYAMANNKRVQEHWKILVPYFDKKGLLDI